MMGMGYPPIKKDTEESDDSLRKRILYVGGDGEMTIAAILKAKNKELDEWAWRFSLERRKL